MNAHIVELLIISTLLVVMLSIALVTYLLVQKKKQNIFFAEKEALQGEILQEKERTMKEIAEEMHDNLAQLASLGQRNLKMAIEELSFDDKPFTHIKRAIEMFAQINDGLHLMCRSLDSGYIKERGLIPVLEAELESYSTSYSLMCWLEIEGTAIRLQPEKELLVYRVVHEAIVNAVKHSGAKEIVVTFKFSKEYFQITVFDNGNGFLQGDETKTKGMGLINMRQRAALLPGELKINSAMGKGTNISITCNLERLMPKENFDEFQ